MGLWKRLGLLAVVCVWVAGTAQGAVITFRSGATAGTDPTNISYVTVKAGPFMGFTSLSKADFLEAQVTPAVVTGKRFSSWITTLPADPAAQWISTGVLGGSEPSGLYAIRIDIGEGYFATDAKLELFYAVDDFLGTETTSAIYLNGEPLRANGTVGSYSSQNRLYFEDLTLNPGVNWIYINVMNNNTYTGVIFSGTVTYTPIPVPEPVSLSLLAAGAAGLLARRRRG